MNNTRLNPQIVPNGVAKLSQRTRPVQRDTEATEEKE